VEPRIQNRARLLGGGHLSGREAVLDILEAGLQGADPYHNTRRLLKLSGDRLTVGEPDFEPAGDPHSGPAVFDLSRIKHIYVLGAGKGIQRVAQAIEDTLGERLSGGHVIDKKGHPVTCRRIGVTLGAHPVPDADCVRGSQKIMDLARNLGPDDLVFTCAGNGVSSLLTLPAPGISLEDVKNTTYLMQVVHGAPTLELNAVRNHLDLLKSGRIASYIQPARAVHIISIDPGSYAWLMKENYWLHNLPDSTTFAGAVANLKKRNAWEETPLSVRELLLAADPGYETVKATEFDNMAPWRVFGVMPQDKPGSFMNAAMRKAQELGFRPHLLSGDLFAMEAASAANYAASIAREIERHGRPFTPPCALFSGGEMVVTVGKEKGVGGRNQEYVMSAARWISDSPNIVVASVDTDGTDGPGFQFRSEGQDSDMPQCLAGGIVDGTTWEAACKAGLNPLDELRTHNTSPLLWKLGSGIVAAPNISLNDLTVMLITGRC
jgi:glycerate 2-kinase